MARNTGLGSSWGGFYDQPANARHRSNGRAQRAKKAREGSRFLDSEGRLKNGWWVLSFSVGFIGGGCLLYGLFLLWLTS